jgi:ribosomal protein S18 acetylase RimI-like enzyme
MNPPIRPFRADDEAALIALWQRCGLLRPWNDPKLDIARKCAVDAAGLAVIGHPHDAQLLIGAVMAGYEGHRGWINYLAVDPAWQRRGLGRQLMAWAETELGRRGCPKINLQVRRGNEAVLGFYRAIGYLEDDLISLGRRLTQDEPAVPPVQRRDPPSA